MSIRNGFPAVSGAADQFDIRAALRANIAQDANGHIKVGTTITTQSLNRLITPRTNMAVDLHPSDWILDRQGPIFLSVDGTETISINPAPSANSRIDTIWIKQQETQSPISDNTDGPTVNKTTGTPSINPTPPTIPDGALAIADILIPSNATNTSSSGVIITQRYPYTAAQGATLTFRNQTELNQWTPYDGQHAQLTDDSEYTGKLGAWVSQTQPDYSADWKSMYGVTIHLERHEHTVTAGGLLSFGSNMGATTNLSIDVSTLPSWAWPKAAGVILLIGNNGQLCEMVLDGNKKTVSVTSNTGCNTGYYFAYSGAWICV